MEEDEEESSHHNKASGTLMTSEQVAILEEKISGLIDPRGQPPTDGLIVRIQNGIDRIVDMIENPDVPVKIRARLKEFLRLYHDCYEIANSHLEFVSLKEKNPFLARDIIDNAVQKLFYTTAVYGSFPFSSGVVQMVKMVQEQRKPDFPAYAVVNSKKKVTLYGFLTIGYRCIRAVNEAVYTVKQNEPPVAIKFNEKVYFLNHTTVHGGQSIEDPRREMAVQNYLSTPGHPNVMTLKACLETPDYIIGVYDWCGENILEKLASLPSEDGRPTPAFNPHDALHLVRSMAEGLRYIHGMGICHRDISLENTLVSEEGLVKIIDFGMAKGLNLIDRISGRWSPLPYEYNTNGSLVRFGKFRYMAPEVYEAPPNQAYYNGPAADVWSLGMCFVCILSGFQIYERPNRGESPQYNDLATFGIKKLLNKWGVAQFISPLALDLLEKMLSLDPEQRLSSHEVCLHPYLS